VGLFIFVSWSLGIIAAVTLSFPLNILLVALAYKVRLGYRPIPLEKDSFWWRSTFAALGLAGFTLVLLGLTYALVEGADFKPEQVELVLLMAYIPAAVWFLFLIYAMEDMLESLGVFLLYLLLPGLPLLLFGWLTGSWHKLADDVPWLVLKE
jgi:hypothetical protein